MVGDSPCLHPWWGNCGSRQCGPAPEPTASTVPTTLTSIVLRGGERGVRDNGVGRCWVAVKWRWLALGGVKI